jgi:hypothetical protein
MEVYERPANKFVVGFFVLHQCFFTGWVKFNGDVPSFIIGNDSITLPRRLKTLLADYSGK